MVIKEYLKNTRKNYRGAREEYLNINWTRSDGGKHMRQVIMPTNTSAGLKVNNPNDIPPVWTSSGNTSYLLNSKISF